MILADAQADIASEAARGPSGRAPIASGRQAWP